MDPAPGALETQSLAILRRALDRLDAGFAGLPQAKGPGQDAAALERVLLDVAERLQDNYPYFHPLYAGQMLKPPHPVARLAYTLALWLNPNNHALDGGCASGTASACTRTPPTAATSDWPTTCRPRRGGPTTGWAKRTPSSSTRTSTGCSPTGAAACCSAIPRWADSTSTTRPIRTSPHPSCIWARSAWSAPDRAPRPWRCGPRSGSSPSCRAARSPRRSARVAPPHWRCTRSYGRMRGSLRP